MLVVLSAVPGEFEASISRDGLTRSQLLYASAIGVKNVIFAVNRMEDKYLKNKVERFAEIVEEMQNWGRRERAQMTMSFIPINSLTGENISVASSAMEKGKSQYAEFWDGPALIELLKSQKKNVCDLIDKPARVLIQNVSRNQLKGLVLAGIVRANSILTAGSSDLALKVKAMWKDGTKSTKKALPGDLIEINFESKAPSENWAKTKLIGADLQLAKKVKSA